MQSLELSAYTFDKTGIWKGFLMSGGWRVALKNLMLTKYKPTFPYQRK